MFLKTDKILDSLTLPEAGVDYLFAVLGSDHPSIIEAYHRRQQEGKTWPKLLIFLHEASQDSSKASILFLLRSLHARFEAAPFSTS